MRVDVWSDVVCPWCYIGKRRLEAALERFPERAAVNVVFHSFQLDPSAPSRSDVSLLDMLARKYGTSPAQAAEMQARVTGVAAEAGLTFRLEAAAPENTFDAHRLLHLAAERGVQPELKEALMHAYFCEGRRVADPATLAAIAVAVGLDAAEVSRVLGEPAAFADAVRADEQAARRYGVRGVPFFVLGQKYGVSGAQSADTLLAALSRAWSEGAD